MPETCDVAGCKIFAIADFDIGKRIRIGFILPSWRVVMEARLCQEHFEDARAFLLSFLNNTILEKKPE